MAIRVGIDGFGRIGRLKKASESYLDGILGYCDEELV